MALAAPALAQTCALDDPAFVPPPNDTSRPAEDIVLISVSVDANGEFVVSSAKSANGPADYAWALPARASKLQPHAAPAGSATPFDMILDRDAIVVFRLEPGARGWESDPARAFFQKSDERHNPFGAAETPPGQPRLLAVRFHAPANLGGCSYAYDLGLVVRQRGRATPLVIDRRFKMATNRPRRAAASRATSPCERSKPRSEFAQKILGVRARKYRGIPHQGRDALSADASSAPTRVETAACTAGNSFKKAIKLGCR